MAITNPDTTTTTGTRPVSEGTTSAQRIEREYGRQFRPMPASVPALQVQETERDRLRRVLSSANTRRVHLVQATKPAHACDGGLCMGDPACPDHHCQGHPANDVTEDQRDARLTRWVWGSYAALLVLAVWFFTR